MMLFFSLVFSVPPIPGNFAADALGCCVDVEAVANDLQCCISFGRL